MKNSTRYSLYSLGGLLVAYFLLLDILAKPLFESQASAMYGAEISIDAIEVSPFAGKVTLHQLQVADRSDAMRNLAQAERAYVDIDILKLAEDIIEVEELDIGGLIMFASRDSAATILRPLLKDDSGIGQMGIPDFSIPDANSLIATQREQLNSELNALKSQLSTGEEKWQKNLATLPTEADIAAYKARIDKLKKSKGLVGLLNSASEAKAIYAEIKADVSRVNSLSKDLRSDIAEMRETLADASNIPNRHTEQLMASLGLGGDQLAQLGSQLLKGDMAGILQQALAPLAYTSDGEISTAETTPIFIDHATISGPLLPSAAGLSVDGELSNFAWPLEIAEQEAKLSLTGKSLDGGTLNLDASIDHRDVAKDLVSLAIDKIPLRNMALFSNREMNILLQQSLATIAGEIQVNGDNLTGIIDQNFAQTVFDIALGENASESAHLIAGVLRSSNDFIMALGLGGTVQSPELSFKANLDKLIATTVEAAISEKLSTLKGDLQNQISSEFGPQITAVREQMKSMEVLEGGLQKSLKALVALKP